MLGVFIIVCSVTCVALLGQRYKIYNILTHYPLLSLLGMLYFLLLGLNWDGG